MARLHHNGLSGLLDGAIDDNDTTATFAEGLTYNGGLSVPTLTGADYIPIALLDSDGKLAEIVWLTGYTEDALSGTISRGQEGTTGVAHADGARFVSAATAYDLSLSGSLLFEDAGDPGTYVPGAGVVYVGETDPGPDGLDVMDPGDVWIDRASDGGGSSPTTALVPLTTVIAGEPSLVWDTDNQLVYTEVPLS